MYIGLFSLYIGFFSHPFHTAAPILAVSDAPTHVKREGGGGVALTVSGVATSGGTTSQKLIRY